MCEHEREGAQERTTAPHPPDRVYPRRRLGYPVLVGHSRKCFVAEIIARAAHAAAAPLAAHAAALSPAAVPVNATAPAADSIAAAPPPQARLAGSLGAGIAAWLAGADILRVHDVAATRDSIAVFRACYGGTPP